MERIVTFLKEVGAVLATVAALAYVTGYLALRARAHALGTEPDLKLVEEMYVFAGFRCLFVIAILSLLVAPVWFGLRWLNQRVMASAGTGLVQAWEWVSVVALVGACSLDLRVLEASGVLLRIGPQWTHGLVERAVLGDPIAKWWMAGSVLLTLLTASRLYECSQREQRNLVWVLGLLLAIRIVTLPVQHGALIADRNVRVLAQPPASLSGMSPPLGIVDRSGAQVTVLARDRKGAPQLIALPAADLSGAGISQILPLSKFVETLGANQHLEPTRTADPPVVPVAKVAVENASLFALLDQPLRVVDAIGSLGESPVNKGEIWEASIDSVPARQQRLSPDADLASPVASASGGVVYALREGALVAIERGQRAQPVVACSLRWRKLLGVTPEGEVVGLAVAEARTIPAVCSPTQVRVGSLPATPQEQAKLDRLLQDTRGYAGGWRLRSARASGGSGFDVVLTGADSRETVVTACGDDSCAHASLTDDSHVLYVRARRY